MVRSEKGKRNVKLSRAKILATALHRPIPAVVFAGDTTGGISLICLGDFCASSRRVMEHDRGTTERPHPRPRPHGFGFMDHSQFTDVKTRIDDPKVFAVPAYCKKADDDDDAGDHEMPTILERFFLL